eukprot:2388008-Pleurochrysis_carterae.AAC.1
MCTAERRTKESNEEERRQGRSQGIHKAKQLKINKRRRAQSRSENRCADARKRGESFDGCEKSFQTRERARMRTDENESGAYVCEWEQQKKDCVRGERELRQGRKGGRRAGR